MDLAKSLGSAVERSVEKRLAPAVDGRLQGLVLLGDLDRHIAATRDLVSGVCTTLPGTIVSGMLEKVEQMMRTYDDSLNKRLLDMSHRLGCLEEKLVVAGSDGPFSAKQLDTDVAAACGDPSRKQSCPHESPTLHGLKSAQAPLKYVSDYRRKQNRKWQEQIEEQMFGAECESHCSESMDNYEQELLSDNVVWSP